MVAVGRWPLGGGRRAAGGGRGGRRGRGSKGDTIGRVEHEHAVLCRGLCGACRDARSRLAAARCTDQLTHLSHPQAAPEQHVELRHTSREQRDLRAANGEQLSRSSNGLDAGHGDVGRVSLEFGVLEAALTCEELEVAGEQLLDSGCVGAEALQAWTVTVPRVNQRKRTLQPHAEDNCGTRSARPSATQLENIVRLTRSIT